MGKRERVAAGDDDIPNLRWLRTYPIIRSSSALTPPTAAGQGARLRVQYRQ